jgi:hypothetical protein
MSSVRESRCHAFRVSSVLSATGGANPPSVSKSLTGQHRHGAPLPSDCPVKQAHIEKEWPGVEES